VRSSGGVFGATGARFGLTKRGGCLISIIGIEVGWGTVWLRGWEVGNEQCVGVGWFWAPHQKRSCQGLVLANKTLGVLDFGPEDGNEVGYTMVEELGGGE
jgi:hypothetical protein